MGHHPIRDSRRPIGKLIFGFFVASVLMVLLVLAGDSPAGASSYTIVAGGAPITVKMDTVGEKATATFSGTAGMRISLKMSGVTIGTSASNSAKVTIKKPDGKALGGTLTVGRNGGFVDLKTLPVGGSYKIVVDPNASATGKMTLTLYKVPADASVTAIPGGDPVTLTTTTPGQNAKATFTGTAGQRVSMQVTGASFGTSTCCTAHVSLVDPAGDPVGATFSVGKNAAFMDARTLSLDGTYTVKVDPLAMGVGSVTLTLYEVPLDASGNLTLGTPSTFETTVPGQNVGATFAGTAGHRVTLELSSVSLGTASSLEAKVWIRSPDATQLFAPVLVGSAGKLFEPVALPATGTYTVVVDPQDLRTGSVTVTAWDVPADPSTPIVAGGAPVTVSTTAPGQNAVATFSGTVGKRISLSVESVSIGTSTCCGAKVSILAPDGSTFVAALPFGTNGTFVDATALPATGTYKILVDPQGAVSGDAVLTLYELPANPSAPLTAGTPATLTTTTPGQNAQGTFTGAVNQRVAIKVSGVTMASSTCCGLRVSILKPNGTALFSPTLSGGTNGLFLDTKTLPSAGTYKVVLDPIGAVVGSATVTLYTVPADVGGAITAGGAAVPVTLGVGQNAALAFTATAGQRFSVKLSGVTIGSSDCCSANVRILKPDGTGLTFPQPFGTNGGFLEPVTIPAAGTYKVLVDPVDEAAGGASVNLYSVPADTTSAITIGGPTVAVSLPTPGQQRKLTFSGTTGQTVTLTASSVTIGPSDCCSTLVALKGQSGASIGGFMVFGTTGGSQAWVLPSTGTYTLVVDPQGASTGNATFGLTAS
ncbi:MAG TPA: hypothetical protein VH306_00360 [Gaiellaceae bacterium]